MGDDQTRKASIQWFTRRTWHFMALLFSIFAACLLILVGILLLWSPGTPKPFLDQRGKPLAESISEKIRIDINGVPQGMFIKSRDRHNPVLLFVHGGPGMPEYWLTQRYPTRLEDLFTVVWWEQRGAGLSYSPDISPETMTAEQFISDTLAVTHYLRQRFHKNKIYLMAHSWGSYIAIQAVAKEPELYHAYLGIGQISYQIKSEQLAYKYALEQYEKEGNMRMVHRLQSAAPTMTVPLPAAYISIRDEYMHDIGIGTTRLMKSVITGIFLPSWQFREYTLKEKINLWRGKFLARSRKSKLWEKMQVTDLTRQVKELKIPVYFFHGIYDYTCAYPLARDYFDMLQAPLKGFYTFKDSAHSPMFEEPEKMKQILRDDVLMGSTRLADSNPASVPE